MHTCHRVFFLASFLAATAVACSSGGATGPLAPQSPATTAPASTATPSPSPSGAIASAQASYYSLYQQAIAHPGTSASTAPLLALYVPGSTARTQIQNRLAGLVKLGYAGTPGKAGYYVIENIAVGSGTQANHATAKVCIYDDDVIYDATHTAPNGSHIIVDDSTESGVTAFEWINIGGVWKLNSGINTITWKGVNRCPPRR